MSEEIISLEHFSYIYPQTEKMVLKDIDLHIKKGSFIGVIGANRAGKSTMCTAFTGLIPFVLGGQYNGVLRVNGEEIDDNNVASVTRTVGIVFQDAESQFSQETVEDEIAFGMCNVGIPHDEMVERMNMVADSCNLKDLLKRSPFSLSGGQQQRVAVACILALRPQVIILDETTSQLDPIARQDVFRIAQGLHHAGYTIIMVDHNIEKLVEYSSDLVVLHEGSIWMQGPCKEVLQKREKLEQAGIRLPQVTLAAAELMPESTGKWPATLDEAIPFFKTGEKNTCQ